MSDEMTDRKQDDVPFCVEVGGALFTADGMWFHTSEQDIRAFAPEVLDRYGLEFLLQSAAEWYRLPVTLSLLILATMLPTLGGLMAGLSSFVLYLGLSVIAPSAVFPSLVSLVRKLNHPVFQGLVFVLVLSFLASSGDMIGLSVGLVGFILLRWQLVSRLLDPIADRLRRPLGSLSPTDMILRNIIVRSALKHGYDVGGIATMQRRMIEIMNYKQSRRK